MDEGREIGICWSMARDISESENIWDRDGDGMKDLSGVGDHLEYLKMTTRSMLHTHTHTHTHTPRCKCGLRRAKGLRLCVRGVSS